MSVAFLRAAWRLDRLGTAKAAMSLIGETRMLANLRAWLSGYKTYIALTGVIVTAVAAWAGDEITTVGLIEAILAALAGMALRAGIARGGQSAGDE